MASKYYYKYPMGRVNQGRSLTPNLTYFGLNCGHNMASLERVQVPERVQVHPHSKTLNWNWVLTPYCRYVHVRFIAHITLIGKVTLSFTHPLLPFS